MTTTAPDLTKAYEPREVEERWYSFWEKEGVFDAHDDPNDKRPVYVVPLPPPNVTGSLHMGHAMMCTLEDVLVRWERMRGKNVLWQPGIDHAGIATQTVVERQLAREGTNRHELGREKFVERVWKWKGESGGTIANQMRKLGASCDWRRTKFTMDPDLSVGVTEAFVQLYEAGLIYRATRLINWCPECRTALSDLEVENEEGANGELFQFAYKVDGSDEELVVATTRPETMLGDTAVAVHPDDERYKHLHGKMLVHPFVDRKVPVITDAILVDPKFGTGAVKVTPAHDFNDFATGKRHNLEEINILTLEGAINENGGSFAGLDRKRARTAVKKALDEKGLARGAKPHILTLPKCQRSGGVVEPMISTQWFTKMKGMADEALKAVHDGRTKIIPEEWQKTYDHFLENIQDWCISRQLWWGHQIPAWHGPNGEIVVSRTKPAEANAAGWHQDPDVLDTWFSSALWPFSTLGWPNKTPALDKFYPASDLETGYDILFFWVARMMMFGLYFMKDVPFRRVLLHGMVVDETGDKMSKVKGNVIDPLDLIYGTTFAEMVKKTLPGAPEAEAMSKFKKAYPSAAGMGTGFPAFGADALRFTLSTFSPSNKRIALAPKRIEGYRHFANKVWNASRLVLGHLEGFDPKLTGDAPQPKAFFNKWILAQLAKSIVICNEGYQAFRIDEAANETYRFFWNDFCDWYLEVTKPVLRAEDGSPAKTPEADETRVVLAHVLETSLRLLHPLMPYVSEELWQRSPRPADRKTSIAFGPFPSNRDAKTDDTILAEMEIFKSVTGAARTIRSEHNVERKADAPVSLRSDNEAARAFLSTQLGAFSFLAGSKSPVVEKTGGPRSAGTTVSVVPSTLGPIEVHVGLKGLVTKDDELKRIEKGIATIKKDLELVEKKMTAKNFMERAPKEVIDETLALKQRLIDTLARLEEARRLADEL